MRNTHTKKNLSLVLFFIYLTNLTGQPVFLFAKFGNPPQEIREGNGNPLQYSCLENPVDRGPWWAAVHRVAQSQTRLKQLSMHACIGEGNGNTLQYSCLENPRDRGAWWAAIYGVTQSRTRLKRLSSSSRMYKNGTNELIYKTETESQT